MIHISSVQKTVITFAFACIFFSGTGAYVHAKDLEVAGWIPYWRDEQGIKDATKNIKQIDSVYPFAFVAQPDGSIKDLAGLESSSWKKFFRLARSRDVEVIPTIMWSDGASMHTVLSNSESRKLHEDVIVAMVKKGGYDGVGIDYEGKKSETKDSFSLFLTELKKKLGNKTLTCTLEARTPPDSLYKEVPKTLEYSNDYAVIGKVCDRIEIMAYDQQRADIKLNAAKAGQPYMPVSDVDWVRKVVDLAVESLPKEKIFLGIATYGHHYQVTVSPDWYRDYKKIGSLNVPDILDVAKDYKVKPSENRAGEMSATYIPKSAKFKFPKNLKIPKDTTSGNKVAAQALAYANETGKTITFNMLWWSDAGAMKDKIDLSKEFGLAGVAFFKFDGEEDSKIWKLLPK